jgi:hypothetical protein
MIYKSNMKQLSRYLILHYITQDFRLLVTIFNIAPKRVLTFDYFHVVQ